MTSFVRDIEGVCQIVGPVSSFFLRSTELLGRRFTNVLEMVVNKTCNSSNLRTLSHSTIQLDDSQIGAHTHETAHCSCRQIAISFVKKIK
jgi:hypothetical protein